MSTIPEDVLNRLNLTPPDSDGRKNELGQQDFLDLMIAQVRNQDPFSPMDNGEFIAQLAQFSMTEGIEQMQQSLDSLSQSMVASQALSASSLVGRAVLAPTNIATTDGASGVDGAVLTDEPAESIVLNVFDAAGALAARIEVPPTASGRSEFSWNGRNMSGELMPAGEYRMSATALVDGESVAVPTALRRGISSVVLGAELGSVKLNLDNGDQVALSSVQQLY